MKRQCDSVDCVGVCCILLNMEKERESEKGRGGQEGEGGGGDLQRQVHPPGQVSGNSSLSHVVISCNRGFKKALGVSAAKKAIFAVFQQYASWIRNRIRMLYKLVRKAKFSYG